MAGEHPTDADQATKATRALGTFGVYGPPTAAELRVLALADDYRTALAESYHEEHEATIELRNRRFPALFAALVEWERCKAWVSRVEGDIKKHHSTVRDRNAVTLAQEEELLRARAARDAAAARLKVERRPYAAMLTDFRAALKAAADWKNVKSLDKRRAAYAAVIWPEPVALYAALWTHHDLHRRELGERFQAAGLGYATRGEIVDATRPKVGKDGPGTRYVCGRKPGPRPWEKLCLQFGGGGLPVQGALAGQSRALRLLPVYVNHAAGGDEWLYDVTQQIGTAADPEPVTYRVKFHRELPREATIQRWALVVRGGRRSVIPLLSGLDLVKPAGGGVLCYDLRWRRRRGGVEVCYFRGDHVDEALVLPDWLVARRMALKDEQAACDAVANAVLAGRGLPANGRRRQGTDALADYVLAHPDDVAARTAQDECARRLAQALRESRRALRCIEKIYETVARRVCGLHAHLIADPIDLSAVRRYDTRDLLREDVLTAESRERLHALAPGKLAALIKGYGLAPAASGEVVVSGPGGSRGVGTTDLFTSWVNGLGEKTGRKPAGECRRSQLAPESRGGRRVAPPAATTTAQSR